MNEEIDTIEIDMNEEEIDEMIAQLIELKEKKESVQLSIASDMDLIINHNKLEESNDN